MGRPRVMGDGKDLKCKRIGAIKLIMYILLLVNYFSLLIILENEWLLSLYIKCIFKLFLENSTSTITMCMTDLGSTQQAGLYTTIMQ